MHLGDRSFSFAGPCLWNSLPVALRDRDISLVQFKRLLKDTLVCVGLRRIVTVAFCAVYKYSYLITYLVGNIATHLKQQKFTISLDVLCTVLSVQYLQYSAVHVLVFGCRAMAVLEPLKVKILNLPSDAPRRVPVPNFPAREDKGFHEVPLSDVLYIEQSDFREV